jgi:hypothetical protein
LVEAAQSLDIRTSGQLRLMKAKDRHGRMTSVTRLGDTKMPSLLLDMKVSPGSVGLVDVGTNPDSGGVILTLKEAARSRNGRISPGQRTAAAALWVPQAALDFKNDQYRDQQQQ